MKAIKECNKTFKKRQKLLDQITKKKTIEYNKCNSRNRKTKKILLGKYSNMYQDLALKKCGVDI